MGLDKEPQQLKNLKVNAHKLFVPPNLCVDNKLMATIPSFTRIGYLLLRAISAVRVVAHSGVRMIEMHWSFFFCLSSEGLSVRSLNHSDFTKFTSTREPSLLIEIESERLMRARI